MEKPEADRGLYFVGTDEEVVLALRALLLRNKFGASATGLGMGSAAGAGAHRPHRPATIGAGEADVLATIKARAPCSAKYAAHLLVPTSPPHKEAATVVGPHHVATYAHGEHSKWTEGLKLQVAVHCAQEGRRMSVDAEVAYHNTITDIAILKVQRELAPPVLDCAVSPGDRYYVHGQSTQAQADATSISHGTVAATELDASCHIRGNVIAGACDSGAGCFSVATGKLFAIVVGSDGYTNKAILLPIAVIARILAHLSAFEAPRAAI